MTKTLNKMKKKIFCFDIDGVISKTFKGDYKKSVPIKKNITKINDFYNQGHIIKIFTARYMGRNKDNPILAKKKGFKFTSLQLKKWKLKYHKLIMGKPSYDYFVDDKSFNNFRELMKKIK